MYYYPENLKGKPTLWFWTLKDIALIGIAMLISSVLYIELKIMAPLIISACYAILTIQIDGTSIRDFILYACAYFLFKTQQYDWSRENP